MALTAEGTVFNIALPAGEYSNATLTFTATDNTVAIKTATTFAVTKNKVSLATFDGLVFALPGVFTVSDKGTPDNTSDDVKIHFSKGNLYAKDEGTAGSPAWKWDFYDEQYKFLAANMAVIGSTKSPQRSVSPDETEINLFTWGYDATKSIVPDGKGYVGGHKKDTETFSPSEDWGSQIGDGNTWRTLTSAEWEYLFIFRTDASDKVGFATVNGVYGIIILPDTFTDPMKNNGSAAFVPKSTTEWTANVYTTGGNWEAMESAGAVFLPAAGGRDGSSVTHVGVNGYYWSSSADGTSGARYLSFDSGDVYSTLKYNRDEGHSVRLITECQ